MISRRRLLNISLTVCGCATCGALGRSGFIHNAQADSPTAIKGAGYNLWFIGGQRETIMNGKLAAALDLRTLANRQHLYGVGPIEQLRGEVTIANSRPALARVASDGSIKVSESFEAGVPFFVWAEVPRWRQLPIPAAVRSFEDLERFVPKAATAAGLDADQPLPFLVEGREELIEFHIVNRVGDGPHNMEMHKKIQITFEREKVQATIIGFHSTKHRGIFTPGDSNIHIHFQTLRTRLELRSIRSARERVYQALMLAAGPDGRTAALESPLKTVASEIGLTQEAFYRAMAALEAGRRIRRRGRCIDILEA